MPQLPLLLTQDPRPTPGVRVYATVVVAEGELLLVLVVPGDLRWVDEPCITPVHGTRGRQRPINNNDSNP